MPAELDPLFALTGPTASGKSEVGVILAERLGTEIISADSVQVYRHFDIGSGKPTPELLERVRHHLIGAVEPEEEFNVARFQDEAGRIARALWPSGKIPLVVGGTMLYIKGLIEGLHLGVKISGEVERELDALYEAEGTEGLYRRMSEADPAWARQTHPHDTYRARRALGVYLTSGKTMSEIFSDNPSRPAFDALIVALDPPRDVLYRRIEERVDRMIEAGWREEIKRLMEMGYNEWTKPMRSVGYRILYDEATGRIDPGEAGGAIKKETKAFAKRQLTWLRKTPGALFIATGENGTAEQTAEAILARDEVVRFLSRRGVRL